MSCDITVGELQTMHPALRLRIHEVDGEPRTYDGGSSALSVSDLAGSGSAEEAAARFARSPRAPSTSTADRCSWRSWFGSRPTATC